MFYNDKRFDVITILLECRDRLEIPDNQFLSLLTIIIGPPSRCNDYDCKTLALVFDNFVIYLNKNKRAAVWRRGNNLGIIVSEKEYELVKDYRW